MVKILKRGKLMKIECLNCGALLQYEYEDIQEQYEHYEHNLGKWKRFIICPQCSKEVITEQNK